MGYNFFKNTTTKVLDDKGAKLTQFKKSSDFFKENLMELKVEDVSELCETVAKEFQELFHVDSASGACVINLPCGLGGHILQFGQMLQNGRAVSVGIDGLMKQICMPNIPLSPAVAFSIVTGCYFLFRINQNLEEIKKGIVSLREYMERVQCAKLYSSEKILEEAYKNYNICVTNPVQQQSMHMKTLDAYQKGEEGRSIFKKEMEECLDIKKIKKEVEARKIMNTYFQAENAYLYAVSIICKSKVLEIMYARQMATEYLEDIKKDMILLQKEVNAFLNESKGVLKSKIRELKKQDIVEKLLDEIEQRTTEAVIDQFIAMLEVYIKLSKSKKIGLYNQKVYLEG